MEIWENLEKRNTCHDFPPPFMWAENNNVKIQMSGHDAQ